MKVEGKIDALTNEIIVEAATEVFAREIEASVPGDIGGAVGATLRKRIAQDIWNQIMVRANEKADAILKAQERLRRFD